MQTASHWTVETAPHSPVNIISIYPLHKLPILSLVRTTFTLWYVLPFEGWFGPFADGGTGLCG